MDGEAESRDSSAPETTSSAQADLNTPKQPTPHPHASSPAAVPTPTGPARPSLRPLDPSYKKRTASILGLSLAAAAAAPPRDPAEYSPLHPPAPPFSASASRRTSRRSSSSSLRSDSSTLPATPEEPDSALDLAASDAIEPAAAVDHPPSPRVELASRPKLSVSAPASTYAGSHMRGYSADEFNGSAQEELLDEDVRAAGTGQGPGYDDPYRWERPLDAVNRHSRLLDSAQVYPSPAPTASSAPASDGRRHSRLPPGVALVDPFGFNVSNEPSPYDLAYAHSAAAQSAGLTATSSPRSLARSSFLGPYPAMGSAASSSHTPSISPSPSTSSVSQFAQGEYGAPGQPWVKPRAASAGETAAGGRAQVRNGLLAPGAGLRQSAAGRSKLSGEIDADAMSVASIASRQLTTIPAVPSESDYLNSRVYQRTLKAQRALEKERAKAAAKGKVSRYDATALASKSTSSLVSTTSTSGFGAFNLGLGSRRRSVDSARPPSVMSAAGVSGTASPKRGGRKSLGWFRSSSEAALALNEGVEDAAGLPTSKGSSGTSMQAVRGGSGQGSPRVSPGLSAQFGPLAPPLPPSPNLPSEATLRAMGVSTDQLRAAAQQYQRPRSSGRQSSGGTVSTQKRSPLPSPRLEQGEAAFSSAPAPATPPVPQPPSQANIPLAPPRQTSRPGPPPRGASLEPPPSSAVSTPYTTPPSTGTHTPVPPLSSVPPRTASRLQEPADIPLPPSASPTKSSFPAGTTAPPPALSRGAPSQSVAAPRSRPPPQPQHAPARTLAASLPASTGPPPQQQQQPQPQKPETLGPPQQGSVKRRKSGLGLLFSGSSSAGAASAEGSRENSPTPSSGSSAATAREKERMVKRMGERAQQQQQQPSAATKLTKEKGAGGGFFSRSASKLRSSGGPSSAPASSGPVAPPPPKGAAPPPPQAKTTNEPFYHPSQALHAARAVPPPQAPRAAPPPSPQQPIRAINPSPQIPQGPTMMRQRPSGAGTLQDPATAPRTDSSSGSSTTFSSLSSNSSTLPPGTPAGGPLSLDGKGPAAAPALLGKKGGFASLFSIGGSIRGRKSSAPAPLGSSLGPSGGKVAPAVPPHKTLPVLPQAPPPAASTRKPQRGQSLGATQQQQPGASQQQQQQQSQLPPHQRPYATYA